LWKSVNDAAVSILQKSFPVSRIRSLNIDWNPTWLLSSIPEIIYSAIKNIKMSYYCPTEDTDTWNYFQNNAFSIPLTDSVQFVFNNTYLVTNVSSPVDTGMWSTISGAATAFLNLNLGNFPNTTMSQTKLAISYCGVYIVDYERASHNADLWKLYSDSFATAKNKLSNLLNDH